MKLSQLLFAGLVILLICSCKIKEDVPVYITPVPLPEGTIAVGKLSSPIDTIMQVLPRPIIARGSTQMIEVVGHKFNGLIVLKFCVDPAGDVTYAEVNKQETTMDRNIDLIKLLEVFQDTYKFEPDPNGNQQQCGRYNLTFNVNSSGKSKSLNLISPTSQSKSRFPKRGQH